MKKYLLLTKPRVIVLLTITGIIAYLIPSLEDIKILDIIIFTIAGYMTSGGAMTVNHFIDRDIDLLMERTKNRPTVGENAINPYKILSFGGGLAIAGTIIAYFYFGKFTAIMLAWGILSYVIGYSMILKRKSMFNTILGGLASPAPVWAGFAARYELLGKTGDFLGVPLEGWLLGAIVFIWTPSHTWALSSKYVADYKAANIPMVPVKYGLPFTAKLTLYWGSAVILLTTAIIYFWFTSSWIFFLVMVIPHAFLFRALWRFYKSADTLTANKCFKMHNYWLAVIFTIILYSVWF